jgi:two-component system cell cycle sensor histidine kinase/response regulator CckA
VTDGEVEVLQDIRGGNETILLVEDEEYLAESTKTILENKGYKVITAYDGVEALEIYSSRKENISLVLSDLGLPRIDGQELFNCLHKINPAIKFVIASGFIQPDKRTAMSDAGIKDFIQKPYAPSDMLRRIRNVLDKQ